MVNGFNLNFLCVGMFPTFLEILYDFLLLYWLLLISHLLKCGRSLTKVWEVGECDARQAPRTPVSVTVTHCDTQCVQCACAQVAYHTAGLPSLVHVTVDSGGVLGAGGGVATARQL